MGFVCGEGRVVTGVVGWRRQLRMSVDHADMLIVFLDTAKKWSALVRSDK
jgi:hypothetical protein